MRLGSFGCNFPVWEKVGVYREFHVCSSSIVTLHERLGLCNLDDQGIRSAGGSTDVPPHALWAARETAGPSSWSREHVLQTDAAT